MMNPILYDMLKETSHKIFAGYANLAHTFKEHPNALYWKTVSIQWSHYWENTKHVLQLLNDKKGEKEFERISKYWLELQGLEKELYFLQ